MALETSLEKPAPVRAIANAISGWIDRLGAVWVEGQVTQVSRRPGLATVFMTLRDSVADISVPVTCSRVMFDGLATPVTEGASVVIHARPSYYANRGTLSLQAREIRMVGLGELLARLEQRRQLLAAEGLFAAERKRRLPTVPQRIGLVTAANSAAERDVIENATRRWPAVAFEVVHAAMQGHRCASEVIEAVRRLDAHPEVDVIVIARGGGSVEDLLPFSDEGLIRVVAAARTPVVSAIGHEPDSPLLDLVADLRASTPTDAAKRVVPDMAQEASRVREARTRIRQAVSARLEREQHTLDAIRSRPVLAEPATVLDARHDELDDLRHRIRRSLETRLDRAADDIDHRRARVQALSPLATLQRGYAVLQDADGHVVTSVADVAAGAGLSVRVADGRVHVTATRTEPIEEHHG
ncbi:exodeoxyribonuclease VII large subunit [Nocardioides sp. zg-536]|uniref:Exodeoxyribonuclease 7 large subunit n=1 Tax=Nocardioides faecalis TaxID=2803858 RepID=A0A938Y0S2_9ACTN|nr:exodeoxyribonuclease VII large subunit [Nocardioides faecalis]MBM9459766.1 exodeoxyribonuclease VII large subunit [Nocardioides faecalis]QVI58281.1 exodeoxyribonuclease VII large subunit [Nocardioides faecalis]